MIVVFERILHDFRSGINIENYIIIALATIILVLDIFDLGNSAWTTEVTLAILALLAYGRISDRKKLDRIEQASSSEPHTPLIQKYPEELVDEMRNASELWIAGISLTRTIDSHYPLFKQKLEQGDRIRVLLVSPGSPASGLAANRDRRPRDKSSYDHDILSTLSDFCRLAEATNGDIELRTINAVLSFGYYAINPKAPAGKIYAEHYAFKSDEDDLPKLVVQRFDGFLYDTFENQLFTLWENAEPWTCKPLNNVN